MNKIASMVGVGAMVISLGLGSAFAQQATTAPTNTPPTAAEKDKAPKPDMTKADPMKAAEAKAGVEVKPEKAGVEMKKTADPVKGEVDKAATEKPANDKTADKKVVGEKDVKADPAKTADTVKKLDEAKSVKQ